MYSIDNRVWAGWVLGALLLGGILGGCNAAEIQTGPGEENTPGACSDMQDNDGDGLVDCKDPECAFLWPCTGKPTDGNMTWDSGPIPDWGIFPDMGPCVTTQAEASNKILPVDIIWFVDTSSSMDYETKTVQNNLNAFAQSISKSGLDYHVVMIGEGSKICVPPPLGGKGCTNGPRYLHVKQKVDSEDGLIQLIKQYPQYQKFLRADSLKHFVAVTDDNSDKNHPATWFLAQLAGLKNPGFPKGFIFHSIVAYGPIPWIGCITGAKVGAEYLALTKLTSGVQASICTKDWTPIFAALAKGVAANTKLPCTYTIPSPGGGKTVDPNKVNVSFTPPGGQPKTIPKVKHAGECATKAGWYYDNDQKPTTVTLCPNLCKSLGNGKVKVLFGCKTIVK